MKEKKEQFNLKEFKTSYYKHKEKGLIDIGLEDIDDFYSPYSLKNNKKIDREVDDHICDIADYIPLSKDLDLEIYLDKMPTDKEKKEAETTFRNYYAQYLLELNAERNRLLILASILLGIGLVLLSCLFAFGLYEKSQFLYTLLEIATWVFVWESLDISCFHCHTINVKKQRAKKLLNADIKFKTYEKEKDIIKHKKNIKIKMKGVSNE